MSKRWAFTEDRFLAEYFDALGDYVGTHDLGRPKGAATKRVASLKKCGAWDILKEMQRSEWKLRMEYMVRTGARESALDEMEALAPDGVHDDRT